LGYAEGQFPESERASRDVLSLPVYPELSEQQRQAVIDAVREFYG
jgi:dTDP-4-amino-4,6-dideoxygalactose transaminase